MEKLLDNNVPVCAGQTHSVHHKVSFITVSWAMHPYEAHAIPYSFVTDRIYLVIS